MKRFHLRENLMRSVLAGALMIALSLVWPVRAVEQESKPPSHPPPQKKAQKRQPKKLNGAELYAIHCNRCHPERYAPERTPEQWKTILLHMRTRANLPAEHAKAILAYLQEDSGK